MAITAIRGKQVLDGSIQRVDLDTTTAGLAVVAKIVQGTGILLASTGMDSGTGDVTVSATSQWLGFISKTAAYTLTSADSGKYFICSGGSWTLTLPTPAVGLIYQVRNDMGISGTTGTITLSAPSGTIDGASTLALLAQQEVTLLTDGTNWRTLGRQRMVVLGTVDITSSTATGQILLPAGYRDFEIVFKDFVPSVNRDYLQAVFSTNGGSTWITTGYYEGLYYDSSATAMAYQVNTNVAFSTVSATGNTTAPWGSLSVMKLSPGSASIQPSYLTHSEGYDSAVARIHQNVVMGMLGANGAINALRFGCATGNIVNLSVIVKGAV